MIAKALCRTPYSANHTCPLQGRTISLLPILGDPSSRPSGAPRQLQAGQDPQNPQRVLLTWSPLPCLLSNAPVTRYVIQFERQGVATPRVAATSALSIKSSASTRPTGLGFIDQNVVYYFRVAAQNANGIGPFSGDQLARTANTPTGEFEVL